MFQFHKNGGLKVRRGEIWRSCALSRRILKDGMISEQRRKPRVVVKVPELGDLCEHGRTGKRAKSL